VKSKEVIPVEGDEEGLTYLRQEQAVFKAYTDRKSLSFKCTSSEPVSVRKMDVDGLSWKARDNFPRQRKQTFAHGVCLVQTQHIRLA
jgi:hypothetical protein